jgi:predicted PurR-regulated permease PerM
MLAIAHSIAIGLIAGLGSWALDLPAPAALGLAAGVGAFLPHLGVVAGSLPMLLLTLGFRSAIVALAVLTVVVVLQLFDSLVLRRHIHLIVEMGLLLPFVSAVLLHALYGVGAVIFGLAYVIFLTAVLDELAGSGGEPETADG